MAGSVKDWNIVCTLEYSAPVWEKGSSKEKKEWRSYLGVDLKISLMY